MGFHFPEIILESVIKDGLENARRIPDAVNDVFSNLTRSFSSKKYGEAELEKILKVIRDKEVSVVHHHSLANAKSPCVSVQLLSDVEDEQRSYFGDHVMMEQTFFSDPDDLANLIVVDSFTPDSYDSKTGEIKVPDGVNLAEVHVNLLFTDASGSEFSILGGISNEAGTKRFFIAKNQTVDLGAGAVIKSSLNYRKYQVKGNTEKTQILVGIHTKDALLTKYLYTLVKYFILSRKNDMISRDFQLSSYQGSDFNRNIEYQGDVVYSRYLTISGMLQPTWRSDLVELIDVVDVRTNVPRDDYGTEDLGLEDSTVQVSEEE